MSTRLRTSLVVAVASVAAVWTVAAGLAVAAAPLADAQSKAADVQTARQGVVVAGDFPTGWTGTRNNGASDQAIIKAAGKISGCKQYVALRKLTAATPQARSLAFDDKESRVSNEVDAFASPAKARTALTIFASDSISPCLEKLFQQQLKSKDIKSATVTISPNQVTGLGDQAVSYEGSANLVGTDGSTASVQLGTTVVRLGRFVDAFTYSSTSATPPTEVLGSAVEASLTRLNTAVNG